MSADKKRLIEFALENPDLVQTVDLVFKNNAIDKLLQTDLWPNAVHPSLIVDETDSKQILTRAKSVVRSFLPNLSEKKFLDFGAGDSQIVTEATSASLAIAYDLKDSDGVTVDWDNVRAQGPYDVILLYDVIDHMTDNDGKLLDWKGVAKTLKQIKDDALAPNGKIYCRCHPWTSRHGTHNYLTNNKAFGHYIDDNIGLPTIVTKEPNNDYANVFRAAEFNVIEMDCFKQQLPPFFDNKVFDQWVGLFTWRNSGIFRDVMSINFVDCVLE